MGFADGGFVRQASEPAKPFNRQVSEQTTTGSGTTMEETWTDLEENASHLAYMAAMLPRAFNSEHTRTGAAMAAPMPLQNTFTGANAGFVPPAQATQAAPVIAQLQGAMGGGNVACHDVMNQAAVQTASMMHPTPCMPVLVASPSMVPPR